MSPASPDGAAAPREEAMSESLRLAYCRHTGLPEDTPAGTCRRIQRYGHLSSIGLRTDEEEAEVQALHQEFGQRTGWHVEPRRDPGGIDLSVFELGRGGRS